MIIAPPAIIGMLGGGQLGRYALMAARSVGYGTIVLDPDPQAPAGRVADRHLVAPYDDAAALDELAARCAVVTIEFENPPAGALERLASEVLVAPSPIAVAIAQDRRAEKRFLTDHGFAVVPYAEFDGSHGSPDIVYPAILKTARLGYDGKGQRPVAGVDELSAAWRELGSGPCVLEQRVALDLELSVIVARSAGGSRQAYAVAENQHVDGILDLTVVPARVPDDVAADAMAVALAIAERLEYAGVLAVEMFRSEGRLLVNELAPRPHNSGHWTLDAAVTSQFAQQVRAICGAALGPPEMTAPAVAMVNLLGDLWTEGEPAWDAVLSEPAARLHLYGKAAPRPGRKMGHVTIVGEDRDVVIGRALELRSAVRRR